MAEQPLPPALEHAFDLLVDLAPAQPRGEHPDGRHWYIPVVGGEVTGPRLSGRITAGADHAVERADGTWDLDARYGLHLADGTPVEVHNHGYFVESSPGGPPSYYQTTPLFRPVGTAHAWLARTVFVGQAHELDPLRLRIEVFAVLDPRT